MPTTTSRNLFAAIARRDEAAIAPLLEPQGPLACAYDLWGWPALDLLVGWGEDAAREIAVLAEDGDRAAVVARWEAAHGSQLDLRRRGERWQAYAAHPRAADDAPLNPAYALVEAGGMRHPWRAPAPDAVEALLRARGTDRLLGLEALIERILTWRLALASLQLPPLNPTAWAAAMEYQLLRRTDPARAVELAIACYGASRRELERATFLLEAGWRLRG